jgi:hypothetical protein
MNMIVKLPKMPKSRKTTPAKRTEPSADTSALEGGIDCLIYGSPLGIITDDGDLVPTITKEA